MRRIAQAALLTGLILTSSCSLLASGELTLDATLVEDNPVIVRVTARNIGEARASWGPGSSTCRLHLLVRVEGVDRLAPDGRVCTADLATHVLDPGESHTETLAWDGRAQLGSGSEGIQLLPPGTYELRGNAENGAKSDPVLVTLETVE